MLPVRARIFQVMDLETIVNCFVGCFLNFKTGEMRTFCVHFLRSDWQEFLDFLEESRNNNDWHLGFNNLAFDAQIIEYILKNIRRFRKMTDPDEITDELKRYANGVIAKSRAKEFLDFPEFRLTIKCHDIFKMNHWDNAAKSCSLKWVEYSMDYPSVEEMPHHHTQPVMDWDTLVEVISYCENDVRATAAIYKIKNSKGEQYMLEQMMLRIKLSETYQVNLHSASETRITKEIFLHYLSDAMGVSKKELRAMRSERSEVWVKDIMLPITFETPDFKAVQIWFEQLRIDTSVGTEAAEKSKSGPKLSFKIQDMKTTWALGGIHGCVPPQIVRSGKGKILISADVTSFYPFLAIENDWHPAHIPLHVFKPTYVGFFHERAKYPKDHFFNKTFKLVLNGTYGQTKDRYSFLYDPEFTFKITINGQLQLTKCLEMVLTRIPGATPIMANTDGFEVLIDEKYKELYYQICAEWELMTRLKLEYVEYDRMIIRDVNNYIAVWTDPKTGKRKDKCKGAFEFDDLPLHKNKSMLVIPKALSAYFLDGVKPEDYLPTNRHFFDYCAGAKLKGDWYFEEVSSRGGTITRTKHQKLLRYYISQQGNKLVKRLGPRQMQLEAGAKWRQITCNQYVEKDFDEYQIDMRYYLEAIRNEIKKIESHAEAVVLNTKAAQYSLF